MKRIKVGWKGLLLLVMALFTLFLAAVVIWMKRPVPRKENGIRQLHFAVGDRLEGYEVYGPQGEALDISDISDMPLLLVFAMAECGDCRREFSSYRSLLTLFDTDRFRVVFVWDDEIPQEDLDELNIPPEASYTARGQYKFTDWVPTCYLVDATDTIVKETTQMEQAASWLPETEVTPEAFAQFSGGLPVLVGIDRCGSCKKAAERMDALYGGEYLYFLEGREEVTPEDPANVFADPYRLLSQAFVLEIYPVCIRLDEAGEIVVEEME